MSVNAVVELDDLATATRLFTYPNDGHADQTLEDTIEHYLTDSLNREGLSGFQLSAIVSTSRCAVTIALNDQKTAKEIEARYQGFFDIGKVGLQAADAFHGTGKWDEKWKFLLPLGVPLAYAKAIEIMDFPPLTLIKKQDYLNSKTTSRWWELLILNGVSDDEKARYSCILDIVPVAAPAGDGEKLSESGIYEGPFDSYGIPLLELLVHNQIPGNRPLIALGSPIRGWITRLWNLTLKVMDIGTIVLKNGATCNVIATNHPSFFYYAVHSNTGPDAMEKNLATGLAIMKQDIVAAAWHAEMGRNPAADPRATLDKCFNQWRDKEIELLELVRAQAGFPRMLSSAEPSIASVKARAPTAEELEQLETQFYAACQSGRAEPTDEQNRVSKTVSASEIDLGAIKALVPSSMDLEHLEREFYSSGPER